MLLPSAGSPQSSPSNTPVSRRRASSRKSRPKPRAKKPSKLAQHASADLSTQESTTQGPGSSDSSEKGLSSHEGAVVHINEDIADSDSEDLYEDTRSVTPNPNSLASNHKDVPAEPSAMTESLVNQSSNHVADLNDPPPLLQVSSKDSIHSNSDENVHDSNETSDTDFRDNFRENLWKNRRFESDLSTAPFSSETSDMDTSGNERILATDDGSNRIGQSKPLIEVVKHRQINSESSGDEIAKRAREVRIVPRPPPKPATLLSGLSNSKTVSKAPPPAKKALHLTKSSPMSGKLNTAIASTQLKSPARNRGSLKGTVPTKPKPPIAAKPKPEVKPRPAMATITQQRTTIIPNGVTTSGKPGEATKPRPVCSPPSLRKIHSESVMKKPPPPIVIAKTRRVSEPVQTTPTSPPTKPAVSPKPGRPKPPPQDPSPPPTHNALSPLPTSAGSEDTQSKTSSSSETLSSQSPSNSPHVSPAVKKKSQSNNLLPSQLCMEHSQSTPSLSGLPPSKPPKDVEKRELLLMQTQAQPTPNIEPTIVKDRSQSDPLVPPLTNGIQSPSPPPVPPRSKDPLTDLNVPIPKDRRTPSPIMNRSNRRPPPNPPQQQEESSSPPVPRRSKVDEESPPPPVPPHSGKRMSIYSSILNTTQINTIQENYEICDIAPEKSIEEYYSQDFDASHVYAEIKTTPTNRIPPSDCHGDTVQYSTNSKLKKKTSMAARRAPPRPPVGSEEIDSSLSSVPVPRKRSNLESITLKATSSPLLGTSGSSGPLVGAQETSDPPKKIYARARRNYEEMDIFDDRAGSLYSDQSKELTLEKPNWAPPTRTVVKPSRRNYEEIDIFEDPSPFDSDNSSAKFSPSDVPAPEPPVSPITMVAVTRQTSSSTLKFNSTNKIPALPVEDLRENWTRPQFSSPQVQRRQAKSFSVKRGQSMICRRSVSDRFVVKPATLDPSMARNGLYRPSSLDNLNDRMDRSIRAPNQVGGGSSSDEEETSTLSPTQLGLPKVPSRDDLYSPSKTNTQKEKQDKSDERNPDAEPLYQYINTAEFLREAPPTASEKEQSNGYAIGRKRNQLDVARHLSQRRLWCEQPEVISSGVLKLLSDEERKLQEAIYEVITSEATYLRSLDVLINHFMDDPGMNPNLPEGRRVLDKRQHHVIFSNVREVREVSARFLEKLQRRQRESAVVRNISDIILEFAGNYFECYVKYCTNQVYQTREMQECLENNMMFRDYLRRLERDKICQALNVQSFLLLPMQRITRLPLLVLAILNRTPLDHPDHHVIERTLRTVQKLVTSCNDGARKMERTEQLVEIHQRLDFGKLKPFPLVSASRQLERKGNLVELQVEQKLLGKIKVKKTSLYVFVFTDYVIITKKKKDPKGDFSYKVIDHASRALVEVEWIESHRSVNFEKSMFKEAESVSRATWAVSQAVEKHAFLVILLSNAYNQCAKYLFIAQNDTDKTRWMESMERQDGQKDEEKIYEMWDCPQVQAIFDYRGTQPDELDLQRGDVVKVYRKMADGWYEGEKLRDLRKGWFPSNFCVEVQNEHTRARNLRETHRLRDLTESLQTRISHN
ncbi:rho guanine nucleotide exchange factor 5-like isoform X3 [Halichondria panicea]